jgi:hypothetical protein
MSYLRTGRVSTVSAAGRARMALTRAGTRNSRPSCTALSACARMRRIAVVARCRRRARGLTSACRRPTSRARGGTSTGRLRQHAHHTSTAASAGCGATALTALTRALHEVLARGAIVCEGAVLYGAARRLWPAPGRAHRPGWPCAASSPRGLAPACTGVRRVWWAHAARRDPRAHRARRPPWRGRLARARTPFQPGRHRGSAVPQDGTALPFTGGSFGAVRVGPIPG